MKLKSLFIFFIMAPVLAMTRLSVIAIPIHKTSSGFRHFFICFLLCSNCLLPTTHSFSQGTWTQKQDVSGVGGALRYYAVGFSIDSKGYIGTGFSWTSPVCHKDFWEWDQATGIWTQKADFGGGVRGLAVSFSIGNKGYIGTGVDSNSIMYNDFWEWDGSIASPTYNTWKKKADFGGGVRTNAVGFAIGTKGYIGTGEDDSPFPIKQKDFWEWDQATDIWTKKTDFGGGVRTNAVGFSICKKGYIGTGMNEFAIAMKDFWEWDGDIASPTYNTWTQKADFGGGTRWVAVGFSIRNKGYIGTGVKVNGGTAERDFWEWDQATNIWNQKADFGGTARWLAVGFSIGKKGYIGTGDEVTDTKDFWEYCDPLVITGTTSICLGQSTILTSSGGSNYLWSTGSTNNSIVVSPLVTTIYSVIVSYTCGNDTAAITINVEDSACSCKTGELFIPNAFSPNSDGENDVLCLQGDNYCIEEFKIIIYDRWGEKVFKSDDPKFCWDGVYQNNPDSYQGMNSAVFVYYLNATLISGEQITKKGNISLIR